MTVSAPEDFAIVIGIEGYGQLPPLEGATADATDFARWLVEVAGLLPDKNHIVLVNSPPTPASSLDQLVPVHSHITAALQQIGVGAALERKKKRIGRRLYFYFSGHGFGPDFRDIGMLMANASTGLLSRNIGLFPYRTFFQDFGLFDEVIYFLDCCRDDARKVPVNAPEFTISPPQPPPPHTRDFVVMAARWGEQAFEAAPTPGERRSGLLSKALFEGLGLDGPPMATDVLDRVTTTSLWAWLRKRIPELNTRVAVDQTPRAEGEGLDEPMVLGTFPLGAAEAVTLNVTLTMPLAGTLRVLKTMHDGTSPEHRRLDLANLPAGQPWAVTLRPGFFYTVEHLEDQRSRTFDLSAAMAGATVSVDFP
jgi:hypothetical protein